MGLINHKPCKRCNRTFTGKPSQLLCPECQSVKMTITDALHPAWSPASERTYTREAPAIQLTTRTMQVRAQTVDEAKRSVEAVVSTDAPATVFDFERFDFIDEILIPKGANLPEQVPLLETHDRSSIDSVLGSVRQLRAGAHEVTGHVVFGTDERSDLAFQKVREGHLTDVSVGYSVEPGGFLDIPPEGSAVVDGRKFTAGAQRTLRVTTRWNVREVSMVPVGADQNAKVRDRKPKQEFVIMKMNKRVKDFLASRGLADDATTAETIAFVATLSREDQDEVKRLSALPDEPVAQVVRTEPTPVDEAAIRKQAAEDERARINTIRALGEAGRASEEAIQKHIDDGSTVEEARLAINKSRNDKITPPVGGNPPDIIIKQGPKNGARALAAGLLIRSGNSDPTKIRVGPDERECFSEQDADLGHKFRQLTLLDICREAARNGGAIVHATTDRVEVMRAAVSSGELTAIFTAVANARLLQSYQEADDTTVWVSETDVPDFKTNERVLLGKSANLSKLARGKEADDASIGADVESYRIARYAKKFAVDEQDIFDDNFGAFTQIPGQLGAAAARLRPDLVYSILLANAALGKDSVALFNATHNNTGTGALSITTLEALAVLLAQQSQDGAILNLRPRFLITPVDLWFTAENILGSATRVLSTAGDTDQTLREGVNNPIARQGIIPIHDDRIGANGVTDPVDGTAYTGDATRHYLAAAPNLAPTIEVAYLAGTGRSPQLRSFNLSQGKWGIGWDINLDIGAKALDFRGLVHSTGA